MAIEQTSIKSPCGRYTVYLDVDFEGLEDYDTGYAEAIPTSFTVTGYEFDTLEEQPDEDNPDLSWLDLDYLETYLII